MRRQTDLEALAERNRKWILKSHAEAVKDSATALVRAIERANPDLFKRSPPPLALVRRAA